MSQPLSFMFNVHANQVRHVSEHLSKAFEGQAHPLPPTVHYLWLLPLPDQVGQPAHTHCLLLTTVYDKDFSDYVKEIAMANQAAFNAFLPQIVGMEKMVPVAQHLNEMVNFIAAHDLNQQQQGGSNPTFKENYTQTVVQIWQAFDD